MNESTSIVGYRNNVGNATVGFQYYYVLSDEVELSETSPFLVTESDSITIEGQSSHKVSITTKGKVFRFNNVVWVHEDGKLVPIKLHFTAVR